MMRALRKYFGLLSVVLLALFATDPSAFAWPGSGWFGGNGGTAGSASAAGLPATLYGCSPSTADNSACLTQASQASASLGQAVYFGPGTFQVSHPATLSPGTVFVFNPGTIIKSTITPTGGCGGYSQSIFYASWSSGGAATTLSANATLAATTLAVNANTITNGQTILVCDAATGLMCQQFTVLSGGGTSTLTVDDPVEFAFASAAPVSPANVPTNIRLIGNGATITGTGDRYFELAQCRNCVIADWVPSRAAGSPTGAIGSFDVGGRDNTWDHIMGDAGGACFGLGIESQVRWTIQNSHIAYASTAATSNPNFYVTTSVRGALKNSWGYEGGQGAWLTWASASAPTPSSRNVLEGDHFWGNTYNGIEIDGGASNKVVGVHTDHNAQGITISVDGASNPATDVLVDSTDVSFNTHAGIYFAAGAGAVTAQLVNIAAHSVQGTNSSDGGISVAAAGASVNVQGLYADDDTSPFNVSAAATLRISGARIRNVAFNGSAFPQIGGTNATVEWYDSTYEYVGGTGTKAIANVEAAGDALTLDHVRGIGALTYGIYAGNSVAATVNVGPGCDFSSATTPIYQTSGATFQMQAAPGAYTTNTAGSITLPWALFFSQNVIFSNATETGSSVYSLPLTGGSTGTGVQPGALWTLINSTTGGFAIALKYTSESDGGCSCNAGHTCLCESARNGQLLNLTGP